MKGKRKEGNEDIRSLIKTSGGKSYSVTLPMGAIKAFRWKGRQKLKLSIDEKKKTILIRDWKK